MRQKVALLPEMRIMSLLMVDQVLGGMPDPSEGQHQTTSHDCEEIYYLFGYILFKGGFMGEWQQ